MDALPAADRCYTPVMVTTADPARRRNSNNYYSHFKQCRVFIKERQGRQR